MDGALLCSIHSIVITQPSETFQFSDDKVSRHRQKTRRHYTAYSYPFIEYNRLSKKSQHLTHTLNSLNPPKSKYAVHVTCTGQTTSLIRWTCDDEVMGSTPGRVVIKWLLLGRVTVCEQLKLFGIEPTSRSTQPFIPTE